MKKREEFAVSLRKEKKKTLITMKREKLLKKALEKQVTAQED